MKKRSLLTILLLLAVLVGCSNNAKNVSNSEVKDNSSSETTESSKPDMTDINFLDISDAEKAELDTLYDNYIEAVKSWGKAMQKEIVGKLSKEDAERAMNTVKEAREKYSDLLSGTLLKKLEPSKKILESMTKEDKYFAEYFSYYSRQLDLTKKVFNAELGKCAKFETTIIELVYSPYVDNK